MNTKLGEWLMQLDPLGLTLKIPLDRSLAAGFVISRLSKSYT